MRLFGLSQRVFRAKLLRSLRLRSERGPGGFRPLATLTNMFELGLLRLGPRLGGTGEEELEVRAAYDGP